MDESLKTSEEDGGVWSHSCPILNESVMECQTDNKVVFF